jgi:hypothetical protein
MDLVGHLTMKMAWLDAVIVKESRAALETFLELNIFILGLKKVSAR